MALSVPDQVAKLRALPRSGLLDLWQDLYKKAAPSGIRREILVPFLAYRIQENAQGGLKPTALAELRRIAKALDRNRTSTDPPIRSRVKTGTRVFRKWGGHTHEVFVTDSGYEYRGVSYRSLSEIARKITGTRWSGPAFFGLKKATSLAGHHDE
jgi:Protein of unknown function (DUF2924)